MSIVKQHIRDYLDEIFVLIKEYWHSPLLDQIVGLVEEISMALNDEFKVIYSFILLLLAHSFISFFRCTCQN